MGTGGDLEYIATLDDHDFKRTQQSMDRAAKGSVESQKKWNDELLKGLQRGFGNWEKVGRGVWLGVAAAIPLASKAVKDYADVNSFVKTELDQLEATSTRIWHKIGADISVNVGSMNSFARAIENAYDNFREWAYGTEYVNARQAQEDQDKIINWQNQLVALKKESAYRTDIMKAQARGDDAEVRRLQADRDYFARKRAVETLPNSAEKEAYLQQLMREADAAMLAPLKVSVGAALRPGMGGASGGAFVGGGYIPSQIGRGPTGTAADLNTPVSGGYGGETIYGDQMRHFPVMGRGRKRIILSDDDTGVSSSGRESGIIIRKFDENKDVLNKIYDQLRNEGGARFN